MTRNDHRHYESRYTKTSTQRKRNENARSKIRILKKRKKKKRGHSLKKRNKIVVGKEQLDITMTAVVVLVHTDGGEYFITML